MNADPYAMSQEIAELQTRVSELMVAVERVTEQRDDALKAVLVLHEKLESCSDQIKLFGSQLDRFRLHIQQGIEL